MEDRSGYSLSDQHVQQNTESNENGNRGLVFGIFLYHVKAPPVVPSAGVGSQARNIIGHCLVIFFPVFAEAIDELLVLLPLLIRRVIDEEPHETEKGDNDAIGHSAVSDQDEEGEEVGGTEGGESE